MRAAIYLRLSKEDKQESIENQRALLRKYANDHGFSVVKEYTDEAISGLTDTRPGFAKMMEDARQGHFDVIMAKNSHAFHGISYILSSTFIGSCRILIFVLLV